MLTLEEMAAAFNAHAGITINPDLATDLNHVQYACDAIAKEYKEYQDEVAIAEGKTLPFPDELGELTPEEYLKKARASAWRKALHELIDIAYFCATLQHQLWGTVLESSSQQVRFDSPVIPTALDIMLASPTGAPTLYPVPMGAIIAEAKERFHYIASHHTEDKITWEVALAKIHQANMTKFCYSYADGINSYHQLRAEIGEDDYPALRNTIPGVWCIKNKAGKVLKAPFYFTPAVL